jgi:hypothetical protein
MRKYKHLKNRNQETLPKNENKAFKESIKKLLLEGWNADEESICSDEDWGWIVLADKYIKEYGVVLRRIKPVEITKRYTLETARHLQARLRKELVEVLPYELKVDQHRNEKVKFLEPLFSLS